MIEKPLHEIDAADLQALVTDKRHEGRRIDYKRDLPELSKQEEKKELVRDVSALANAAGGDLIFGVEEDKDGAGKNLGIPKEIVGVACENFDLLKQRFEGVIGGNVEPRVQGLAFHRVEGFKNGPVIIVRVPRSWTGPHMVTSTSSNFWTRNNSGRQELGVHEIRAAFIAGTEIATRVKRFRDDRIGKIVAGETPLPLSDKGEAKVVLHVVPISVEPLALDLHRLEESPGLLPAFGGSGGWHRFNLDGFVRHAGPNDGPQQGYTQAFRDGAVEGVCCTYKFKGQMGGPMQISGPGIEGEVVKALDVYLGTLAKHGFGGPVSVMLTVLGARGCRLYSGNEYVNMLEAAITIDRDVLILPDLVVEQIPADARAFMRPTFDALWQSSGYKRSFGYKEDGSWDAKRHSG